MKAYAFIPARAGSKRVIGKNLREVGGVSLIARAVRATSDAGVMPFVSSDSEDMLAHAFGTVLSEEAQHALYERTTWAGLSAHPIGLHLRPPQLATDHAQIEAAIAHWWTRLDDKPDAVVLLQPTSPFRTAAHVRDALRLLEATGADSVVGVTVGHEHHFAGRLKPRDGARPWFDWQPFRDPSETRPRTQDLAPRGHENGSIYVTRRAAWEASGLRMSGHTVALPMSRVDGWDVDTEQDLAVANALAAGGVVE